MIFFSIQSPKANLYDFDFQMQFRSRISTDMFILIEQSYRCGRTTKDYSLNLYDGVDVLSVVAVAIRD